ncbi:hypothetical protein ACFC0S_15965 [Streptomyces sp. NPDC056084]|uniref:hypothetical protein n=1 Tax=unclassified Streptomyces TaxID=2593676 RepID=UPI0035E312B3
MTTAPLLPRAWQAHVRLRPRPVAPDRHGRGRPPALTSPEHIEQLLVDIRTGATVAEAAAALGLSRTPVYNLRRTDPLFAAALTQAQAAGRAARRAGGPDLQIDQHGTESSYTKRNCLCDACRAAGTRARARRRADGTVSANSPAAKAA